MLHFRLGYGFQLIQSVLTRPAALAPVACCEEAYYSSGLPPPSR